MDTNEPDLRRQQTSLSFIEWDHITHQLAATVTPLVQPGAEHLLPDSHLRAHLVTTLLNAGVQPHELHLDAPHPTRAGTTGRVELRLDLDTGITTAITLTHPRTSSTTGARPATASWFTAVHRAVTYPAHEHITVALLDVADLAHLTDQLVHADLIWPAPGHVVRLDADHVTRIAGARTGRGWNETVQTTCLGAHPAANHQLMAFQSHTLPDQAPTQSPQPRLW